MQFWAHFPLQITIGIPIIRRQFLEAREEVPASRHASVALLITENQYIYIYIVRTNDSLIIAIAADMLRKSLNHMKRKGEMDDEWDPS